MNPPPYADWIGRREQTQECLSGNLVKRIAATLGQAAPAPGDVLPPLWHWAFFQPAIDQLALGRDGHPAHLPLLPPTGNRNRMWAGGRMEFFEPLRVDAQATRSSTLLNVEEKAGRTGALLFATLRHDYLQDGNLCLREDQDIVFREPNPPRLGDGEAMPPADWQDNVEPTTTLLMRYSAVTFNTHRIHYDWPYATGVEGYPGLVVHGPLIATLNLRAFCRANPDVRLRSFAYRGVRPLIAPEPFQVGGRISAPGKAELWAGDERGIAQQAELTFD
ncbi:MaoC family dehydratase N-terminal domain-containing protein [Pseudomonas sp. GD03860]|uniref:FAS1-like dehydratase domain-containing protein n=1 Tax=Pseudomonas TaxID=286 RepID=UPI0023647823|nr:MULTISPECIES: MaoC family dehydratase N-terminal domain-containing protein [Pseudomonas]MDD2058479.1 MaoC family dehydratase N-terminal domain-containing protein [Pseudomonas putida]MDH0640420.1 MaoC family dehydratase N-terminal domain-containing protein [Pseudomonas sp. GD03860]